MKNLKIFAIALVVVASYTNQSFAQETAALKTRTKSNNTNERTSGNVIANDDWQQQNAKAAQGQHIKKATFVCRVIPTDGGCIVTLDQDIKSSRDAASGLATGKRMHKPFSVFVSASDNAVSEVKSPRDAASGLPTGKRQHKPVQPISTELDKASPKLLETIAKGKSSSSSSSSEIAIDEPGVGKVAMQDMHFTISCGGKTTKIDCVDGRCEIPVGECPNGTCTAIASWSWGASNTGSMSSGSGMTGLSRCSVSFSLEIEGGECTAMAINEKGLPGDKKPNTSTTNNPK